MKVPTTASLVYLDLKLQLLQYLTPLNKINLNTINETNLKETDIMTY